MLKDEEEGPLRFMLRSLTTRQKCNQQEKVQLRDAWRADHQRSDVAPLDLLSEIADIRYTI